MLNTLDTTKIQPEFDVEATIPLDFTSRFETLRDKRVVVESRGDPDEYLALAREFFTIGADSCANSLIRKAAGMRKAVIS